MRAKGTGGAGSLRVFYGLFFMAVGVSLPFLPGYFVTLGLTGAQIGGLLAVGPLFALVAPPAWGQLADRTGRHGLVLAVLCLGGAAGYALLARAHGFVQVLLALAFHAAFGSAITTLADAIALHHTMGSGRSYASVRTWGSIGFVVSSVSFGVLMTRIDRAAVLVPLALFLAAGAWAWVALAGAPPARHEGPKPDLAAALRLLRSPGVGWFLAAAALHWAACAPYHGSLTLHITALGLSPAIIGLSAAVAVGSEVLVMSTWTRLGARVGSTRLLLVAFGASGARWLLIASTSDPRVLVASSLLHGLTFGVFYLAAVAFIAERAPGSLRATGQALFVAATFGVGGLVGYIGGGRLFDLLGGHWLFVIAGAAELLPMAALLRAERATRRASAAAQVTSNAALRVAPPGR